MVTLKMLASACGVSVATVSKALNGAPDVSAETAERIRKAAADMGYIPCAAARYLKTSKTHNIGVIFNDGSNSGLTHEYFAAILNSLKQRAEELGYDVTLISNLPGPWGSDYATHVQYRNCDGVAIVVVHNAAETVHELQKIKVPVVTVDYNVGSCSVIRSDNVQGIRDLVTYIYQMGHRKIAFISGEETPVSRLRKASFFRTCQELGVQIPEEYLAEGLYHDADISAQAVKKLLALPDPPTCIMFPDDFSFIGGKNEIERQGMSVPEDISATGFDGILMGKVMSPQITTVQQNSEEIGRKTAEELVRAIEEGIRFIPGEVTVPCTLVPGGTVKKI